MKNSDFFEFNIINKENGEKLISFARLYGLKNI